MELAAAVAVNVWSCSLFSRAGVLEEAPLSLAGVLEIQPQYPVAQDPSLVGTKIVEVKIKEIAMRLVNCSAPKWQRCQAQMPRGRGLTKRRVTASCRDSVPFERFLLKS